MTAVITEKSVRIIIDIPDASSFDWVRACDLWAGRMKNSTQGYVGRSGGNGLGYCWYKVNPKTNVPYDTELGGRDFVLPMPGIDGVDSTDTFAMLFTELDKVKQEVYRLKTSPGKATASDKAELIDRINELQQIAKVVQS